MKTVLAFLLGAVVFLVAAAAIWFYLATRTSLEGHSQPHFASDRVTAILFSMALGSAFGAAGRAYVHFKGYKTMSGWTVFFLMIILPFISSFILLYIAHSQLHSMQFSDDGEPQSPWGYLIICGLPVVVGLFAGGMIENAYPNKETDPIKETESLGTIPDPQPETIIDSEIQNTIAPLKDLIEKEKRKSMFDKSVQSEINEQLYNYCNTKEKGLMLIKGYNSKYGLNLIEKLKMFSTSYDGIKAAVSVFIDLEIIDEKYPYAMKEK